MSIITNRKNLPLPLFEAIKKIRSSYNSGKSDFTATGLLKPARITALEELHKDTVSEDASNMLKSVHGSAIHMMLELAGKELISIGYIVEERFYIRVCDMIVGAQVDLFDKNTGTLYDWKTTSVAALKHGLKEEHVQQLNIGAECLRQNGFEVKALKVAALPTDWREWESTKQKNYPEMYSEIDVPLIPSEEVIQFIEERIVTHLEAKITLPNCTVEETWGGNRCKKYCSVSNVCEQYQANKHGGAKLLEEIDKPKGEEVNE